MRKTSYGTFQDWVYEYLMILFPNENIQGLNYFISTCNLEPLPYKN